MSVPAAAIEAAAEALRGTGTHYNSILHADKVASIAIEAAMPAIREAIAQELESAYPRGTVSTAARIVRGGAA